MQTTHYICTETVIPSTAYRSLQQSRYPNKRYPKSSRGFFLYLFLTDLRVPIVCSYSGMVVFQSPNRCHRDTRFFPFNIKCYCSPNLIIRLGPPVPPLQESTRAFPSSLARACNISSSSVLPSVSARCWVRRPPSATVNLHWPPACPPD